MRVAVVRAAVVRVAVVRVAVVRVEGRAGEGRAGAERVAARGAVVAAMVRAAARAVARAAERAAVAVAVMRVQVRARHLRRLDNGGALGHVLGQGLGGLVADEAVPQARDERVHALLVQHGELGQLVADLCRKQRQASASRHTGSSSRRQVTPQAAPSFGPFRPIGRVGRAGRPCRPLLSDREPTLKPTA